MDCLELGEASQEAASAHSWCQGWIVPFPLWTSAVPSCWARSSSKEDAKRAWCPLGLQDNSWISSHLPLPCPVFCKLRCCCLRNRLFLCCILHSYSQFWFQSSYIIIENLLCLGYRSKFPHWAIVPWLLLRIIFLEFQCLLLVPLLPVWCLLWWPDGAEIRLWCFFPLGACVLHRLANR